MDFSLHGRETNYNNLLLSRLLQRTTKNSIFLSLILE